MPSGYRIESEVPKRYLDRLFTEAGGAEVALRFYVLVLEGDTGRPARILPGASFTATRLEEGPRGYRFAMADSALPPPARAMAEWKYTVQDTPTPPGVTAPPPPPDAWNRE
jgi:hypothetical protein